MAEIPFAYAYRAVAFVLAEGTNEGSRVRIELEIAVSVRVSLNQEGGSRTYRLQQELQNRALHSGFVFLHLIFSFSDFRRHWWHDSPGIR
jgi:hypothetical protein